VAIARALAVNPDFLIADEPTSALDVSVQVEILELLAELKAEMELALLFITHDLSVVRHVSDRIAVMYLGHLVEVGPSERVFSDPRHPYTQALLSSIPVPDPGATVERIPLVGDVPTPIDPPSGCRFHPRCPKVIPPADWEWSQPVWRELFQFTARVADGEVDPGAVRSTLTTDEHTLSDAEVTDELYRIHVEERIERRKSSIPEPVASEVRGALAALVGDDREDALERLEELGMMTVCERDAPEMARVDGDTDVRCHLYTDAAADRSDASELIERNRDKIL